MVKARDKMTSRRADTKAANLTDKDIAEIRRRYETGEKQKDIALQFGVSRPYVSMIVKGCSSRRPLSANRDRVEALMRDGAPDTEIAATFGVTTSSVGKFRRATLKRRS